ncbi:hypothetical protein SAMN05660653_01524 [Desulfonatronum thiosulfatophilum]|uniref:Uncharacterized protein n=1 Tax=Desulfonatronum thiosulfatophilum TaxID=617002 RepID=A0A1G6CH67_9BACT|nr:hypothetical protein [Desulfonatronum thiosulfatophilum]SDB32220.1 hypothetical protein SAMN05660653_01524 [Desulfonatronum thiosulfatophilum]
MTLKGYSGIRPAVDPDKGRTLHAGQADEEGTDGLRPKESQENWSEDFDDIPPELLDATVEILDCLAQQPENGNAVNPRK